MTRSVPKYLVFAGVTLAPAAMLWLGTIAGPGWGVAAILYLSLLAFAADEVIGASHDDGGDAFAPCLPAILAMVHLLLLPVAIRAVADPALPGAERGLHALGFGLMYGVIGTANAHELIHRPDRWRALLGRWVFIALLFGHHASAHRLVHHVHVATPDDPNSARRGRSFYRFFCDAWIGSFRKGLAAEAARCERLGASRLGWRNPYGVYVAGTAVMLGWAWHLAGVPGILALTGIAIFAQAQLLLSDYVQHYGLRRPVLPDGRHSPLGPEHAWNASFWFSARLTLNASSHSHHHLSPATEYDRLCAAPGVPLLPYSIPVMAVIALWPPLWFAIMNPLVDGLSHGAAGDGAGPRPA